MSAEVTVFLLAATTVEVFISEVQPLWGGNVLACVSVFCNIKQKKNSRVK